MRRRRNRRREEDDPLLAYPVGDEDGGAGDGRREYSGYRGMWMFAMFDLPVTDKEARKRYARFRKALLERGFTMLQFSVYARHCASEQFAEGVRADVRAVLPPEGQVRLLGVTDRQFGKMEVYFGKKRAPTEDPPTQFMLF
ncbi:MAG: CRISPR-associated endonuclease Cas2 [Phycisphaerales bacterium]